MRRHRRVAGFAALLSCLWVIASPVAGETTAQFEVSAIIEAGCLVDGLGGSGDAGSVGLLDFGLDSAFSTATRSASLAATQSIRMRCTPGVTVSMTIDGGTYAAAGSRHLQLGDDEDARIAYSVCSDAACSKPVSIGGVVDIPVSGANENDVLLPVHGRLTLPGSLPAGTYTDTVLLTLTW